ncbi:MAG: GNAT family N-acetyltransferase [Gilvibacter sp.]
MNTYDVVAYSASLASDWNHFLNSAKNATFLFHRNFMDYHSDRFSDASLMIYDNNKLVGLLPANLSDGALYSHQGLSYGGIVVGQKAKFEQVAGIYKAVLFYLEQQGTQAFICKLLPTIYESYPADESQFLMTALKAQLHKAELSSTIDLGAPLPIQSNRKEGVKKGQKAGLVIKKEKNFEGFWDAVLIPNLKQRHEANPVHTKEEIAMLAGRFPEKIHQFNVYHKEAIVGGATIFETTTTAHVQYISAIGDKQQLGTLDFLFEHLITKAFAHKYCFDFGISTIDGGTKINKGLLYWKECFGARSTVNLTYKVDPKNHVLLDTFLA